MAVKPKYGRVLLKLSGEAISAKETGIIDFRFVNRVCEQIKRCSDLGVGIAVVIGAGNIWRGAKGSGVEVDRVRSDQMGMLGTLINSLAVQDCLIKAGVDARVMSAIPISQVCETYSQSVAESYLAQGKTVITSCGVGYPFFSTDTGMMLRAAELKVEVVLSAKNIDYVYDKDPMVHKDAKPYKSLTYTDMLKQDIKAIDQTAILLGKDNNISMILFGLSEPENIYKAVIGEDIGTFVSN